MNVYDSGKMIELLSPLGYTTVDAPEQADMVILNTCHIREKATDKLYSELGRLALLKNEKRERGDDFVIAVAGCVAQAEGEQVTKRAPAVDMVFGPQTYHRLPEMIAKAARSQGRRGLVDTEFPVESKFDFLPEAGRPHGASAFLSIQEGCDKFCTFCVVPYTRGAEYSRPVDSIIREAERLVDQGVVELTLLGQNVNAYHGQANSGEWSLARLLYRLAEIPGLQRLRYTTSHPRDMADDLIHAHGAIPQLMPFLHLPVQSGADKILQAMNRKYTAAEYLTLIDKLRAARPDIAFSSDFIVGFPGETASDFAATLRLIEQVGFAQAFSFSYSPRPGTPAAALDLVVPDATKHDRLQRLQALLIQQQTAFNASMVGTTQPALFEKAGKLPGQVIGKSPYMQSVVVSGQGLLNKIVPVHILAGHQNSLQGEVVVPAPAQAQGQTAWA